MSLIEIYDSRENILKKDLDIGKGYIVKCPVNVGIDTLMNHDDVRIKTTSIYSNEFMDYFNYFESFGSKTIEDYLKTTNNLFYKELKSEILIEEKKKIGSLFFYGLKCLHLLDILPDYELIVTSNEGMSSFSQDRYLKFLQTIQNKRSDKTIVYLLVSTTNKEYEKLEINDLI